MFEISSPLSGRIVCLQITPADIPADIPGLMKVFFEQLERTHGM